MKQSFLYQRAALFLTAITPVLLLIPYDFMKIAAAFTSAGAAIATGILAIHGYRENYVRYGSVWHTLQTEKYLYLTSAKKEYQTSDPELAARRFASRIEQLVIAEVTSWQSLMLEQDSDDRSRIRDEAPQPASGGIDPAVG